VDTSAPQVQSIALDKTLLKAGDSATVTIRFSEKVIAFDVGDLVADNASLSDLATDDGGQTWTATLVANSSIEDTSNLVQLSATYTDIAGNVGAAGTSGNYSLDTKAPTATIKLADEALQAGETTTLTITFSEKVQDFGNADVTVQNGTLGTLVSTDGIVWTGTYTPSVNLEDTTNVITLANTYSDLIGNAGSVGTSGNYSAAPLQWSTPGLAALCPGAAAALAAAAAGQPPPAALRGHALSVYPRCPADTVNASNMWRSNDCLFVERSAIFAMGVTLRTSEYRYTEWLRWNGSSLQPQWGAPPVGVDALACRAHARHFMAIAADWRESFDTWEDA
jgi:hypothetical protein